MSKSSASTERDRGGRLGRYDLIAELPREDGADLYLAAIVAPGGAKLAVIRRLPPPRAREETGEPGSALEALRLRAGLKHANIIETYEVASDGGDEGAFVATEYVEGQSLARILERIGPMGLGRGKWLRILVDVLAGLHYAHEAVDPAGRPLQLTHLALTAARIFVTYDGQVKVDFLPREEDLSDPRAAALAPEQARGDRADRRADIFAVGALLWEASAGAPLWGDEKGVSGSAGSSGGARSLAELANGRIPSLRAAHPSVPPLLADIVARALAPRAEDRYPSAMYLQADLEGFLRASGEVPTPKQIGRVVAHAFIEERLRTRTIVEEQLRRLRTRGLAARGAGGAMTASDDAPVSLLRLETGQAPATGAAPPRGAPRTPGMPLVVGARRATGARRPLTATTRVAWLVSAGVILAVAAILAFGRAH